MPYINKFITNACGQRAYEILLANGYEMRQAQRLIDRGRLLCDGVAVSEKNARLFGSVGLIKYEANPKGLKPVFECENFAVFDKPSGVLSHPNGRHCEYSLNDEIQALWGNEACVAHRLDRETSGLIMVAKNRATQVGLKGLFEARAVKKTYLALVRGRTETKFCVFAPLRPAQNYDDIKTRMDICKPAKVFLGDSFASLLGLDLFSFRTTKFKKLKGLRFYQKEAFIDRILNRDLSALNLGLSFCNNFSLELHGACKNSEIGSNLSVKNTSKPAVTDFERICYFKDLDVSLLLCRPLTGRQHQIRLHLFFAGSPILGEPLYGLKKAQICDILDGKLSETERVKLTGARRLMLHAKSLEFSFLGQDFRIESEVDFMSEIK